ncbi:MAG: hypothetical protein MJ171_03885 [Clostridia bacterium]|nr:hypothetical protein [Clostridia bacterium]
MIPKYRSFMKTSSIFFLLMLIYSSFLMLPIDFIEGAEHLRGIFIALLVLFIILAAYAFYMGFSGIKYLGGSEKSEQRIVYLSTALYFVFDLAVIAISGYYLVFFMDMTVGESFVGLTLTTEIVFMPFLILGVIYMAVCYAMFTKDQYSAGMRLRRHR